MYQEAREYAKTQEDIAREQVMAMDVKELRDAYISMAGMVAYYTKIERDMTKPRLHLDAIQELLKQIKAEQILRQAELAEEQGVGITGTARVPAKPLIDLLSRLQQITS